MPLIRPLRALVFALALAAPVVASAPAAAETVITEGDDPAIAAAVDEARAHLAQALAAGIGADGIGHPALTLKVGFPVETGEAASEVIWVSEIRRADDGFAGKLANDPLYMPGLKAGDPVSFAEAMIADWGLVGAEGRIFGHFTTRVLIDRLPEAEATAIRAVLTEAPLPAAWQ
ncbi:MAG: DUF2314 domain-containing protein [Maritimibacter sp.]|nr:DUF2314 domain-containing protein [Maritimibacter sp.]